MKNIVVAVWSVGRLADVRIFSRWYRVTYNGDKQSIPNIEPLVLVYTHIQYLTVIIGTPLVLFDRRV